jgi:dTDP-4-dehydrorhamnose 3,5-epimerase
VVHAYRNISRTERGMVLNYPDTLYAGQGRNEPVDEVRHEVDNDPFFLDFLRA